MTAHHGHCISTARLLSLQYFGSQGCYKLIEDHYSCSKDPSEPFSQTSPTCSGCAVFPWEPAALLQSKDLHEFRPPSTSPALACEGAGSAQGQGKRLGQVWEGCHGTGVGWGCLTLASVVLLRASAAFSNPVLICLTQGHLRRWLILRKSIFQKVIAENNAWFLNSEHSWACVSVIQFLLKAEGKLPTPYLCTGNTYNEISITHYHNSKRLKSKRLLPYNFGFSQPHLKLLAASALSWEEKKGFEMQSFPSILPRFHHFLPQWNMHIHLLFINRKSDDT